jgi:2-C-methyl-D-erythritol 2,4-cyclodiphosphate synthase
MDLLRKIIREETQFRTGLGFDVHQFQAGRRMVLGGVDIPCDFGLLGHSDADVVTHAAMDACLGAAGLPDIGHFFPDTSADFKDADSIKLAVEVGKKLTERGFVLVNLDLMVMAEKPRLADHREQMSRNLAEAFGVEPGQVTVKATTMEKLGFIGRQEGIATMASALLRKRSP